MYPDFLGIGAQKAGTTWLYRNLEAHPGVWMPPRKEIHYFDKKARGYTRPPWALSAAQRERRRLRGLAMGWTRDRAPRRPAEKDPSWDARYHAGDFDDRWYASLFEGGAGKVVGEITPSYSTLDRDAVAHVHGLMPEARIVFFMRNPIERVWSQTVMSFDKAERDSARSAAKRSLVRRAERRSTRRLTSYLDTLETWGSFYPPERVFVGFLEDVHLFPGELVERLYGFLGVDPSFRPPDLEEKVHTRSLGRVPLRVAARLAGGYRDEISSLSERFGGYAGFWNYCAERLIEHPTGGHVEYPFTESPLWKDWVDLAGEPRRPQSGPLDRASAGD